MIACYRTWPLATSLWDQILSGSDDPYLLTWVLAWDVHALATQPTRLFHANIFFPAENSLAFSDHLVGVLPIFAPCYLILGSAVAAYNVTFILSFALSGWAAFALARYWTGSFWPSLAAGAAFGFALFRLSQVDHMQLLNFFWAPLALISLDRFLRDGRWRSLGLFAVLAWLQILSSFYLGAMFAVALALYLAYALVVDRTSWRRCLGKLFLAAVASALGLAPFFLPYLAVHRAWRATRPLDEVLFYTPDVLDFAAAPPLANGLYVWLFAGGGGSAANEKYLFPGLVLPLLITLGLLRGKSSLGRDQLRYVRHVFALILVAGVALALGPYLIVGHHRTQIPLPYLAAYYLVPGWDGMRVPGRFVLLATLGAIPLVALGCQQVSHRLRRIVGTERCSSAPVAIAVIVLVVLELGMGPFPLYPTPLDSRASRLYQWLAREQPGPIVELPFGQRHDYHYLFFSILHWLPLANGQSGFFPPTYEEVQHGLADLPGRAGVTYASALGLRAIVVHTSDIGETLRDRWKSPEPEVNGLRRVAESGLDVVFSVPEVSPVTQSLHAIDVKSSVLPSATRTHLPVLVAPPGGAAWRHPGPHGFTRARVDWKNDETGRRQQAAADILLPAALSPGQTSSVSLPVTTPERPGHYTMEAVIPSLKITLTHRATIAKAPAIPTSAHAGQLAARYDVGDTEGAPWLQPSERVTLTVTAHNVGSAVWLSRGGPRNRGAVQLGWRWFQGAVELRDLHGRLALAHDVYPGASYRFRVVMRTPTGPGDFTLELGLVSEGVTWFSDVGTPPLLVEVHAPPELTEIDRERRLLARLFGAGAPVPERGASQPSASVALNASTFRPGSRLRVSLRTRPPEIGDAVDVVVGGVLPDGGIVFVADRMTLTPPRREVTPGELTAFRAPDAGSLGHQAIVDLPISDRFPPGRYEVFALLVRRAPGRAHTAGDVLALDTTTFRVLRSPP